MLANLSNMKLVARKNNFGPIFVQKFGKMAYVYHILSTRHPNLSIPANCQPNRNERPKIFSDSYKLYYKL